MEVYARHVAWLGEWLERVDLRGVTLVCQDWGSLLGLRLAAAFPERFARIVVANGFLPTATTRTNNAFYAWSTFAAYSPMFMAPSLRSVAIDTPLACGSLACSRSVASSRLAA